MLQSARHIPGELKIDENRAKKDYSNHQEIAVHQPFAQGSAEDPATPIQRYSQKQAQGSERWRGGNPQYPTPLPLPWLGYLSAPTLPAGPAGTGRLLLSQVC